MELSPNAFAWIGVGLALLGIGSQFSDYRSNLLTGVFCIVAFICFIPALKESLGLTRNQSERLSIFIFGSIGFLLFATAAWMYQRHSEISHEESGSFTGNVENPNHSLTEPQSTTPASPARDSIIEISYEMKGFGLPILIEPFATTQLILIREDRKVELRTITNNQDTRLVWPTAETITPPEQTGKITLSNHGDVGIFNIAYSITFRIGMQQGPEGLIEVPFTLPLHDLPLGKSQPFTIVNQSAFPAVIGFSKEAVAQIQGQAQRRQVPIQSRDITLFDRVPLLIGSWHKWAGLKILEPDKWKKKKKKNLEKT